VVAQVRGDFIQQLLGAANLDPPPDRHCQGPLTPVRHQLVETVIRHALSLSIMKFPGRIGAINRPLDESLVDKGLLAGSWHTPTGAFGLLSTRLLSTVSSRFETRFRRATNGLRCLGNWQACC